MIQRDEAPVAKGILPSNPRVVLLTTLLCSTLLLAVPGCSGCFGGGTTGQKPKDGEKEEEKPKPNFEVGRLRVMPSDDTSVAKNAVKPGHWTVTSQRILANNFEFPAELHAESVERNGRSVRIEATPYQLSVSTPAPLPKAQPRAFEMTYYVPPVPSSDGQKPTAAWLHSSLRARRGGREVADTMQPTTTMPDYQYYLVVLAEDPSRYTALKRLDCVMPPADELADASEVIYYRVLLPRVERGAPLPSHAMAWTSISVLVWDGMDPTLLTPYQQDAMLDWLHFGGQLIISGPASLDKLRGSFLDAYLPADKVKAKDLTKADFEELNSYWSLEHKRHNPGSREDIRLERPLVGVELKIRDEAETLHKTGGLVAERMLGRGRIVVTGFPLAAREIKNWGCYDSFVHNALLRRPRRTFAARANGSLMAHYSDFRAYDTDPRLSTTLRIFSRDVQSMGRPNTATAASEVGERRMFNEGDTWRFGGHSWWVGQGMGGWNNRSGAAVAAREALKRAAGITIPSGQFVLKVLVIYLVFLVPVNWCVFRLMGRVEWAWISACLIAIVGSVAVVRLAQLDIGFARSRTEVAVMELHGGYQRGHLTRFTALYTSLSTTYRFIYEEPSAVALPFPANLGYVHSLHDSTYNAVYSRDENVMLSGFTVPSNSTGMIRSEHMYDLEGPIAIIGSEQSGLQIKNDSQIPMRDAAVLRRVDGQLEVSYIGELPAKTVKPLNFTVTMEPEKESEPAISEWAESKMFGRRFATAGEISLVDFGSLAANTLKMRDGDVRLVAWSDEDLAGAEVQPAARQVQMRTLVLVHLTQGPLGTPRPDINMRFDFMERRVLRDDEGNEIDPNAPAGDAADPAVDSENGDAEEKPADENPAVAKPAEPAEGEPKDGEPVGEEGKPSEEKKAAETEAETSKKEASAESETKPATPPADDPMS